MSDVPENEEIEDPVEFFASLGGLRDVRIDGLTLDIEEQVLRIYVDDLYWHFEGSPDYPGERPCALVFAGVTGVKIDVDMADGLRIAALEVNENISTSQPFALGVGLNIGGASPGGKSLVAMFATVEIEDIED
jgi:hypothetical protein